MITHYGEPFETASPLPATRTMGKSIFTDSKNIWLVIWTLEDQVSPEVFESRKWRPILNTYFRLSTVRDDKDNQNCPCLLFYFGIKSR